jgi:L-ribulokinase
VRARSEIEEPGPGELHRVGVAGAVAAGLYPDLHAASAAMGRVRAEPVVPDPAAAAAYKELFAVYTELHDHFGRGGSDALHRLRALRNGARGPQPAGTTPSDPGKERR